METQPTELPETLDGQVYQICLYLEELAAIRRIVVIQKEVGTDSVVIPQRAN